MRRLLIFASGVIAALVLAACGSGSYGQSGGGGQSSAARSTVITTSQVAGVGKVLVDGSGMALYVNDQEKDGTIHCDGACTAVWHPVTATDGTPKVDGVSGLGTMDRSGGTSQVTLNGLPLYTFDLDSAGKVKGDNAADQFGSQKFLWHVALASGGTTSVPATGASVPATGGAGGAYGGQGGGSGGQNSTPTLPRY